MPGPAPQKNARRKNPRPDWVTLPKAGRKGTAPKWPLSGRAPAGWEAIWRKPQAVMWERNGDELVVARYVKLRNLIQDPESLEDVNAAAWSELRQIEDRLGLSPMALKRLQWEIGDAAADVASSGGAGDGKVVDASDRFKEL